MTRKIDFSKMLTLPCIECGAKCCRYVSVEMDRPTCKADYYTIRWYLLHRNVHVYIDHDNDWYVEFITECEALQPDHRCGAYETRPQVCRDHGWPAGSCEHFEVPYKVYFKTSAEYEAWLDRRKIDWRWKRRPKTARM